MQLTGVPNIREGKLAALYAIQYIHDLQMRTGIPIVSDISKLKDKTLEQVEYRTVMINGCYELGFLVNREALHDIMKTRYDIQSIFESEGYPGVRIPFYYNKKTIGTPHEGLCKCNPVCPGPSMQKARKNKERIKSTIQHKKTNDSSGQQAEKSHGECRRIAIMVFQSGSVIISGGCSTEQDDSIYEPYHCAYRFINRILLEIIYSIRMVGIPKKIKKSRASSKAKTVGFHTSIIKNQSDYEFLRTISE